MKIFFALINGIQIYILGLLFIATANAQNTADLEKMLDLAEQTPNPIEQISLCDGSNLLDAKIARQNSILEFEFSAFCEIDTLPELSVAANERLFLLEGQLTSRVLDKSIDIQPAHEMFKLEFEDGNSAGLALADAIFNADFARPLEPLKQRRFKVVYSVSHETSGLTKVWHPAHNNEVEAELAEISALGIVIPSVSVNETKKFDLEDIDSANLTNFVPQFCLEPADWFTPSSVSNAEFEISVTTSCFFDGISDQLIVEGVLASLQPANSIILPNASVLFQLISPGGQLDARNAFESELAPGFSGELPGSGQKSFAIMFELPEGTSGSLFLRAPMRSTTLELTFGELPKLSDQITSESIELDLSLATDQNGTYANKIDVTPIEPESIPPIKNDESSADQHYALVPQLEPQSAGFLISRASDGAKISVTRGSANKDTTLLHNGWRGLDDEVISLSHDGLGIYELLIKFPNDKLADVAGLRIDTTSRTVHSPVPSSIHLYVSESGDAGPWTDLGKMEISHRDKRLLTFAFSRPIKARAIRVVLTGWEHRLIMSEIDVVEVPNPENGSVLDGLEVNLAHQSNGARIVRFNSQLASWPAYALLRAEDGWAPKANTFPQDIVVGFHEFRKMDVTDISIDWNLANSENWKPRVKISASADPGALGSFVDLGVMTAKVISETVGRTTLHLPEKRTIKWLKITVSNPGTDRWALSQLRVNGPLNQMRLLYWPSQDMASLPDIKIDETEPNDTFETAIELPKDELVNGRSDNDNDVDYYTFDIAGNEPQIVAFKLTGQPWIRTQLELIDSAGSTLFTHNPLIAETVHDFTWRLQPGRYAIRLQEPASGISMVIDDSGSMGDSIHVAKEAARLFALSKRPEEQLSLFRFSGPVRQLSPLTADNQKLAEIVMTGIDQSEPGGTSVFDAVIAGMDSLIEVQGNRAVILLTDGEDVSSKQTYPAFWAAVEKRRVPIYVIGLGRSMRRFDRKVSARLDHMLEAIALGSGGAYFDSPSAGNLQSVWKDIAERIRNRGGYSLQWSIPDSGSLMVVETGEEFVAADALGDILFVLDASGSMRAKTDHGRKRIDVAKTILFDMLSDIPDSARVGLRIYGSQINSKPKHTSCRDSILAVPIGADNRRQTIQTVANIAPKGQTPIGRSLAAVSEDMSLTRKGLVVLLTDGEETCDPKPTDPYYPVRVIDHLRTSGIDVRVNIVGFDVIDPKIQQELSRVAEVSGGTFFAAEGEAGLRKALREAFTAPVLILDDLNQVIAESKVGAAPVKLAAGVYQVQIGGRLDLAPRQLVQENKELRLYINKEGSEVRTSSEIVPQNTPMKETVRLNLRPAVSPEQQTRLDQLIIQELNTRPPSTAEESTYRIQAMLTDLGYTPGAPDGKMGPSTRQAISEFLKDHGLAAGNSAYDNNGNPDPMLWISVFGVHTSALLRPILFGAEIPPDIAARLR